MMEPVLLAMLVFQIKHYLCDFVLQTRDQIRAKGNYLEMGGIVHAGLHMLGSIPALLILTTNLELIALLAVAEFVIHYHTDWAKAQLDRHLKLDNTTTLYWAIFGGDQLIHQSTYLGMVFVVIRYAG